MDKIDRIVHDLVITGERYAYGRLTYEQYMKKKTIASQKLHAMVLTAQTPDISLPVQPGEVFDVFGRNVDVKRAGRVDIKFNGTVDVDEIL